MILADVTAVIASLVGLLVAVPALLLAVRAVLPGLTRQTTGRFARTAWLTLPVGIGLLIPLLAPAIGLMSWGPGPVRGLGILWLGVWLLVAMVGATGLATHIGASLAGPADAGRPWLATLKGGVVLTLVCGLPVVGWFLLLPAVLVAGTGAAGLGAVFRLGPREAVSADEASEAA
jgi:hypothetical protein